MSDMKFSKEERKQLMVHIKAITDWIEENILPHIRNKVKVDFGGTYRCPGDRSTTTNYHIYLYPEEKHICYSNKFGYIHLLYCREEADKKYAEAWFSDTSKTYCIEDEPITAFAIIQNWEEIKARLLAQVEDEKGRYNIIRDFKV